MAKILNKKFGIGLIKAGAGNVWTEYKSEGFNWRLAESRGSRTYRSLGTSITEEVTSSLSQKAQQKSICRV